MSVFQETKPYCRIANVSYHTLCRNMGVLLVFMKDSGIVEEIGDGD